ncbi:hypothetical protein R3P38DRAFT_2818585 [Favolaschia claudopus]|uniref:Uncharacterized protein n=1 Tax=Favolaschia claudopus TaxID=2862362 RepID=A0AAW0EHA4_9AGAR
MEVSNELPFNTPPLSPKSPDSLRSARNTNMLAQFQRSLSNAAELFEHLNADYAQEKANGAEIRSCLESQYIQLREREAAVQAMQEEVDREREALYLQRRTQEADFEARSNDLEQQAKTFMSRLRDELSEELTKREAASRQLVQDAEVKATGLKSHLKVVIAEHGTNCSGKIILSQAQEDLDAAKQELLALQTQHSACSTEKRELAAALASSKIALIQAQKKLDASRNASRTRDSQHKEAIRVVLRRYLSLNKSRTQSKQLLSAAVESNKLLRDLETRNQKSVKALEDAQAASQSRETQHRDAVKGHQAEISSLKESLNASKSKVSFVSHQILYRQYTELELRHRSLTTHAQSQSQSKSQPQMDRLRRTLKTVEAENERLRADVAKAVGREHVRLQEEFTTERMVYKNQPAEVPQMERPRTPPRVPERLPKQAPSKKAANANENPNPGPSPTGYGSLIGRSEQTRCIWPNQNQNQQLKRKGAPGATDWGSYKIPRRG